MAKRKSAAESSQPTPEAIAAGTANLAKGRAAREKKRKPGEYETAGERWGRLLSGQITVEDLDDDEIKFMRVRSSDGTFNGKGRAVPSHLLQAFHGEAIKRSNNKLRTAAPEAVQALIDIGRDPSVKESDRVRALMYVVDRALGKTPETVHVKTDDAWGNMERDAIVDDRDLADLAGPGIDLGADD